MIPDKETDKGMTALLFHGRRGAYDNALVESFVATLKTELLYRKGVYSPLRSEMTVLIVWRDLGFSQSINYLMTDRA